MAFNQTTIVISVPTFGRASIASLIFCFFFMSGLTAQPNFPVSPAISGLIPPLSLSKDSTLVRLKDYYHQTNEIDSITFSKGIKYSRSKSNDIITIKPQAEMKPLAEMKIWIKGVAYSVILKKAIDTDRPDAGKPAINTSRLGRGSFTVAVNYSRSPFSIACYWQNFKLGKAYLKHAGEEMLVSIPEEAQKMKRSYIRIFANDDVSRSNDILIPLEYGEVVNNPKQVDRADNVFSEGNSDIARGRDAGIVFAGGKPLDSVAAKLEKSMYYYGSHHSLSVLSHKSGEEHIIVKAPMLVAFLTAIPGAGADSSYLSGVADKSNEATISRLIKLRTGYLALLYGETNVVAKGEIMMIKRSYFSQTILFVFNRSKEKQSIETGLDLSQYKSVFSHPIASGKVELPPDSFEVLIK